jgi:hypothetical protein
VLTEEERKAIDYYAGTKFAEQFARKRWKKNLKKYKKK